MLQEFSTDEVSEKLIRMDIKNRNIIDEVYVAISIDAQKVCKSAKKEKFIFDMTPASIVIKHTGLKLHSLSNW